MDDNVVLCNLAGAEIPSDPIDLPPPDTKRWVTRRKAMIIKAVRSGAVNLEEVCRTYELSLDQFIAWERAIDTHGIPGLRVTRLQIYRDNPPSGPAKPRRSELDRSNDENRSRRAYPGDRAAIRSRSARTR